MTRQDELYTTNTDFEEIYDHWFTGVGLNVGGEKNVGFIPIQDVIV